MLLFKQHLTKTTASKGAFQDVLVTVFEGALINSRRVAIKTLNNALELHACFKSTDYVPDGLDSFKLISLFCNQECITAT